jgi:hypothetical protein
MQVSYPALASLFASVGESPASYDYFIVRHIVPPAEFNPAVCQHQFVKERTKDDIAYASLTAALRASYAILVSAGFKKGAVGMEEKAHWGVWKSIGRNDSQPGGKGLICTASGDTVIYQGVIAIRKTVPAEGEKATVSPKAKPVAKPVPSEPVQEAKPEIVIPVSASFSEAREELRRSMIQAVPLPQVEEVPAPIVEPASQPVDVKAKRAEERLRKSKAQAKPVGL